MRFLQLAVLLATTCAVPAAAKTRQVDLSFTATNFQSYYTGPEYDVLPQATVIGSISYKYTIPPMFVGVQVFPTVFNLTIAGHTYSAADVYMVQYAGNQVSFEAKTDPQLVLGTNFFTFRAPDITNANSDSPFTPFVQFSAPGPGWDNFYYAEGKSSVTFTSVITDFSGAPEPAAWAMLLIGFGGIGSAMRRRARPGLAA